MKFAHKLTVLFISISVIVITIMLAIAYFQVGKILESEIRRRMESRVIFTMDALGRFLSRSLNDIKIIAGDPVISSGNATAEQITERLIFFRNTYKQYGSLSFFNLERIRIADTAGLHIGKQHQMVPYWEDVLSGKMSAARDVRIAEELQVPIVYFASVVNNKEGRATGVVVARLPASHLFEMAKGNVGIQEEEMNIINKDGLLIYSNHNREGILKEHLPEWESIKMAQREKIFGSGKSKRPDEKEMHFIAFCRERGYLDFKGNGWIIVSHVPTRVVYGPINKLFKILVMMFIVMLPGLVLAGYLFSKTVSLPLPMLSFSAGEIGKGKLDTVIEVKSKDEFGSLANTFKQMAADLKKTTISIDSLNKEITEREKTEWDLKNQKAFIESTLNAIPDIFYAFDKSGKFLIWNESFRKVTGYSDVELHRIKPTGFFLREDIPRIFVAIERIWKDGVSRETANLVLKDGTQLPYEFISSVLKDGVGNIIGFSGTGRDLSERKKAEEDLSHALKKEIKSREILSSMLADNNEIRKRLEQNIEELKRAQALLVQAEKLSSIGQLAAGVAHEVKNPLAVIQLGTEYLMKKLDGQESFQETLSDIDQSVKRANSVVKGLLNLAGVKKINLSEEKILAVIDSSILRVKHELIKNHVNIVKGGDAQNLSVGVDKQQMEQVFINLFMNAIQAMGVQGGDISVYLDIVRMTEELPDVGRRSIDRFSVGESALRIVVRDRGPGFSFGQLEKLFGPFYTTKTAGLGTGLGLVVVKEIVELHGGIIIAANHDGGGAQFSIYLKIS